jgi:hypothetical protein
LAWQPPSVTPLVLVLLVAVSVPASPPPAEVTPSTSPAAQPPRRTTVAAPAAAEPTTTRARGARPPLVRRLRVAPDSYPPLAEMDGSAYEATFGDDFGGLPNNGSYASDSDHPNIQLAFNDSDASGKPDSFILDEPNPNILTVTFPVVAASFSTVQIYGTSTEGSSSLTVTLNYTDNSTDVTTFTVPDWFSSWEASSPVFVIQESMSRFSSSGDDFSYGAALYGASCTANSAKTLQSVTAATAGTGRFVLYGATAY